MHTHRATGGWDASSAPDLAWGAIEGPSHVVQLYRADGPLIGAAERYVAGALSAGDAAVVIVTAAHRDALEERLRGGGVDLGAARSDGAYVPLDAAELVASLLVGGRPDAERFEARVGEVVRRAGGGGARKVRALGEMVALLWGDGRRDATRQLEALWEDLARRLPFTLVCAYPLSGFRSEAEARAFLPICSLHASVLPSEDFAPAAGPSPRETALALLEQRASALGAERAAAARQRDELLALLGHELRNPLAALQSALAGAAGSGPGRERALEIAERQARQLEQLVDGLLDAARGAPAVAARRREPVSLREVALRAAEAVGELAANRGHALSLAIPHGDLCVLGDRAGLERALAGVLENAVRFSGRNGRIDVALERQGARVAVRVRDSGDGISPELLDRVFEPLVQGERPLDRPGGGLGLGLAVARALVEEHGGTIEAHSEGRGCGAEFVLLLPLALPPPELRSPRATGLRVLVVDDNRDVAESLVRLLEGMGHSVCVAHDGLAGLGRLESQPAQVALVDIGLPGIDGYELARRARSAPGGERLLLIAVTGYGEIADRQRALEAGFDHHFVKPVDLAALREVLGAAAAAFAEPGVPR